MISFKEYILEYYKGNPILNVRMDGNHKDPNRAHMRKHMNTTVKEYKHKHPIVDNISTGKVNNITVAGPMLDNLLAVYETEFTPNETKVLGNSNVSITMSINNQGIKQGICKKR